MTQVTPGTLLAGKYRFESLIGRGGMGSVWRAQHLGLGAPVAIKLLDQVGLAPGAEVLNRFHREARAAAAIRSPHVVQILDHGVDEALGAPYIVMELMEGESLAQRLARCGRVSPAEAARVFTHVARALTRAHEAGIVHRDLKPDNVFLVRNEDEEVAKVLDFGIAKAQGNGLSGDSATRTGAVMGTAYYMSPEQISGAKTVDFRTDLWAFGVMAFECLTGTRPFDADTIGGLTLRICVEPLPRPSGFQVVPAGFDEWFARIVNRDPALRYGSAREAADALRQVCTGEPIAERVAPPQAETSKVMRASTATTGAPLSRSAGPLVPKRSVVPWAIGGVLILAAAALLASRAAMSQRSAATPSAQLPGVGASGEAFVSPAGVGAGEPASVVTPDASAVIRSAPDLAIERAAPAPLSLAPKVPGLPLAKKRPAALARASSAQSGSLPTASAKPVASTRDLLDSR